MATDQTAAACAVTSESWLFCKARLAALRTPNRAAVLAKTGIGRIRHAGRMRFGAAAVTVTLRQRQMQPSSCFAKLLGAAGWAGLARKGCAVSPGMKFALTRPVVLRRSVDFRRPLGFPGAGRQRLVGEQSPFGLLRGPRQLLDFARQGSVMRLIVGWHAIYGDR